MCFNIVDVWVNAFHLLVNVVYGGIIIPTTKIPLYGNFKFAGWVEYKKRIHKRNNFWIRTDIIYIIESRYLEIFLEVLADQQTLLTITTYVILLLGN